MTTWSRGSAWALVCATIAAECGCRAVDAVTSVGQAAVEHAATASNQFGFDLYQRLRGQDGNLIFSPASAEFALAMTSAGALGETLAQMESVLHLRGVVEPHAAFGALLSALRKSNGREGMTLSIANRLWAQQSFSFNPDFLHTMGHRYDAPLGRVNFGESQKAREAINRWVAGETRDRIPSLLGEGEVTSDTRLVLANAVYFKGAWRVAFDQKDTKPGQFRTKGGPVPADLMHRTGKYRYGHVDGVQLAELPYRGGLSMLVVLPDADGALADVEGRLAESYGRWLSELAVEEVDLEIPRWKTISDEMNLGDHLRSLGMQLAFSDAADFSAMTTQEKLHISLVIQKAFVQVTEEGTEAAAATAVIIVSVSAQVTPQFHADHPFLYFIRDPETGLVLFMGRVLDPR
jgi:serpin B